jgi:hypothetical protein
MMALWLAIASRSKRAPTEGRAIFSEALAAGILLFAAPSPLWAKFPSEARAELSLLRDLAGLPKLLLTEIAALRAQLQTLSDYSRDG